MCNASLAQLAEHALRKRMVVGSIPTGGFQAIARQLNVSSLSPETVREKLTPKVHAKIVAKVFRMGNQNQDSKSRADPFWRRDCR